MAYTVLEQKASSVAPVSVTIDHMLAWLRAVVTVPGFLLLGTGEAPERASVFPDVSASVLEIPEALHRGHGKQ